MKIAKNFTDNKNDSTQFVCAKKHVETQF